MAENMNSVFRRITTYVGARLRIPTESINHIPWQEREKLFDAREIQVCWICGLPYVLKAAEPESRIELLAAPVMIGERYLNRPIYFSDIVVRAESRFQSFADLRGASWVYNEPRSQSGFNIIGHHLRMSGESLTYFGEIIESGAHQTSIRMILDRKADFSAIDSTVLDVECSKDPSLRSMIRIIGTMGPSPIPPWVVLRSLPETLKQRLRNVLFEMHTDPEGAEILEQGRIARFARVDDCDYDSIRETTHLLGLDS